MPRNGLQDTKVTLTSGSPMATKSINPKDRNIDNEKKEELATSSEEHTEHLQASSEIFPFTQLPPELRNKIYHYALVRSIVYPYNRQGPSHRSHLTPPAFPSVNLISVSRQIYNEARSMLYHENIFSFDDPYHMREFVTKRDEKDTTIRNVEFILGKKDTGTNRLYFKNMVYSRGVFTSHAESQG
ncbi:MAG: hypothetical protein M1812_004812 [Candelaria pacifica]|nr:MAG: hypothetical protein M1812_004812 [Candelaria pacifica]